jgi:hypothetical protein
VRLGHDSSGQVDEPLAGKSKQQEQQRHGRLLSKRASARKLDPHG